MKPVGEKSGALRPTTHDLAWAAGLFEGEGTVTIGRRGSNDTYRLIATVQMTDHEAIAFFDERWSGWMQYNARDGVRHRPTFVWTVNAQHAEDFLCDIAPYLHTSRVQEKVAVALRFRELQSSLRRVYAAPGYKDNQRALYQELATLNLRGAAAIERDRARANA